MMQADQYGIVEARAGDQNFTIVDILDTLESAQKAVKRLRDMGDCSKDGAIFLVITLKNRNFEVGSKSDSNQQSFKELARGS